MKDNISNKLKVMGSRSKLVLLVMAFVLLVLEFFVHRHAETDIENFVFFWGSILLHVCPHQA